MRIRVLSGCLAISGAAIIGSGAAAQAATLSPSGGGGSGNGGWNSCPPGEQYSSQGKCCKPTPTPTPTQPWYTQSPTPWPSPTQTAPGWQWVAPSPAPSASTTAPVTVVTVTPSASPSASATAVVPVVVSSSPVPSGPANTGGGMAGGSDVPLAAGGGAIALVAAPLGLVALRRWRRTRAGAPGRRGQTGAA